MKKPVIKYLSKQDFEIFKNALSDIQDFNKTEKYGLTIFLKDESIIIICNDPSLDKNEKAIILWHEKSHAMGILDEEDADIEALKHLSPEAQDILIDNWEDRHGHKYKGG